ncbi:MAG TPA: TonB-dependent receptor plug domain-containing protein [Micropepsaceae bacterium]|nr:TonB-dependent receptor plug domain-containing protein [Micropepsaceae bacterium]
MNPVTTRFASLMGSVSFLTLTNVVTAHAQAQMAQAIPETIPEQVLVTGSLIHGTAAVGVPVTNLGVQDFTQTGAVTIGDLFRTVPEANVAPGPSALNSGGHQERETRVNIRGLDATGPRSLLMVDGVRFPPQADGICAIDPSIIPSLALDRVDILADGASATYGSDAIAGVINIILKRGFDGAVTQLHAAAATDGGGTQYQASQLWGRTWDGGDITLTYEWTTEMPVKGTVHSKFTTNFNPWGLEDPFLPISAAIPGVISTGAPKVVTTIPKGSSDVPLLVAGTCTNCWSIPRGTGANWSAGALGSGPTAPSSAPGVLNWATLTGSAANSGDNNFVDPLTTGWELAGQQKNSFVATVDQRLFPGVSFFGSGFYTNRRVDEVLPSFGGQGLGSYLQTWTVPTTNPYYPVGAPAGLQVSYDLAHELPPTIPAWEISWRYQFGVNLDLPFGWDGQIYDSRSYENVGFIRHFVSTAAVTAALNGSKPATVPYLNIFCDPYAFQCNSPATLAYIAATSDIYVHYSIDEKGAKFDGPLLDLPGGQAKIAIGGLYDGDNVSGASGNNQTIPGNPPVNQSNTPFFEPYHILAGFAQLDIPIFGDNLNLPLVRKLDIEGSFRYDDYGGSTALNGSTKNPKVAFTWLIDELVGATVRGSWGTNFRFANAGEYSTVLSGADQSINLPTSSQNLAISCGSGGTPAAGSAAAVLFAAGFACGSTPGGVSYGGGPEPVLRSYTDAATGQVVSREGGTALAPEKAVNYSLGFELAPTFALLRGLDLQATWYSVKINGQLSGNLNLGSSAFADPTQRYHIIVPSDLGCPVSANANPTSCAPFVIMASAALNDPRGDANISQLSNLAFINDSGTVGTGFLHVSGIDWNGSYDLDLGDLGAWNIGATGTYYLHRFSQTVAGGTIIDQYHQTLGSIGGVAESGVETLPRLNYRARIGWSNGPLSATLFYNYNSHFFDFRQSVPPNVNMQCTASGGTMGGGTFPCAIGNYTRYIPAWNTFDLSLGYNTGDIPANDYLKRITLQLTVQNLMGIHSAFSYGPNSSTRNPGGYDLTHSDLGRLIGLTIVKTW